MAGLCDFRGNCPPRLSLWIWEWEKIRVQKGLEHPHVSPSTAVLQPDAGRPRADGHQM